MKKLEDRVKDALATESQAYTDDYFKTVLENIHRIDEKFHRAILLLIFSVAMYELAAHTWITEVTLGPFKLSNLALLQKYIPIVVSYAYCAITSLGTLRKYMRHLIVDVMSIHHQSTVTNDLEMFIVPPSLLQTSEIVSTFSEGVIPKILRVIMGILTLSLLTGPIAFLVHSFYQCFVIFGFRDVNLWISAFLSLVLVLQGILVFAHYVRDM